MRSIAVARVLFVTMVWVLGTSAHASSWADISNPDATAGLKSVLNGATVKAVERLGAENGFWNNEKVKIPLPGYMENARKLMNALGMKKQTKELQRTMNHAAELAMNEAKPIFVQAITTLNVQDAKSIIAGGQDSVTAFFKTKTSAALRAKFLPVVKTATDKVGLARQYNEYAARGAALGVLKDEQISVEAFVAQKALDGLFVVMAEEEKTIRSDPVGQGSAIVKKVFGAFGR